MVLHVVGRGSVGVDGSADRSLADVGEEITFISAAVQGADILMDA